MFIVFGEHDGYIGNINYLGAGESLSSLNWRGDGQTDTVTGVRECATMNTFR